MTLAASGLLANELMAEEKVLPFCSSMTRLLVGVEELKKAIQLAVIWATAPELAPLPLAPVVAGALVAGAVVVGRVDVGALVVGGWADDDDEVLVVLQAAVASTAALAMAMARPLAALPLAMLIRM
jgi:hypothetical protein